MIVKKNKKKELTSEDIKNIVLDVLKENNTKLNKLQKEKDQEFSMCMNRITDVSNDLINLKNEKEEKKKTSGKIKIVDEHIDYETCLSSYNIDDVRRGSIISNSMLEEVINKWVNKGFDFVSFHFTNSTYYDKKDVQEYKSLCKGHVKPFLRVYIKLILKYNE